MEKNWVAPHLVFNLDATMHQREVLRIRALVQRHSPRSIEDVESHVTKGTTPTTIGFEYQLSGIRFVRSQNVLPNLIAGDFAYISAECNSAMKRSQVKCGDVLINLVGASIGRAAVYPFADSANVNQAVGRIRFTRNEDEINPRYVASWINTSHAQALIFAEQSGQARDNFDLHQVRELLVPSVAPLGQKYIGDKVRQAELLRAKAENLLVSATRLVDLLIDRAITEEEITAGGIDHGRVASPQQHDHSACAKHTRTRCGELTNRIDAWYYQPHLVAACQKIRDSGNCQTLADVIDGERDVKGGATPLGAEYLPSGNVRFYRSSEVSGLAVHAADAVFITDEQDRELARSRLADGDVLLTITGADFGHAGAIAKRHLPGNISQHSVRFRPTIDESYLVAYLESSYGQLMIWRQAYGATRPAIDYPGVKSLLVRVPDPSVQKIIGDAVRSGVLARDCAMSLTAGAKLLVEALIEGKITEDELVDAQQALERGDQALDRAILSRLTEDGIDVAGQPQLFADLDALYTAIDEAQRTQPSNGDAA